MTASVGYGWFLVSWVVFNLGLFALLFVYGLRLRRRARSTAMSYVATALVLVAGTLVMAAVQRVGIHASRVGLLAPEWEDFFLLVFQLVLSLVGTVAGIYAVTRLRAGLRRMEDSDRVVSVLTEGPSLDVQVSDWGLTARELQVVETIVSGQTSDEQIAKTLFISTSTAATHVRNILRKSGLSRRLDLMLVAHRERNGDD